MLISYDNRNCRNQSIKLFLLSRQEYKQIVLLQSCCEARLRQELTMNHHQLSSNISLEKKLDEKVEKKNSKISDSYFLVLYQTNFNSWSLMYQTPGVFKSVLRGEVLRVQNRPWVRIPQQFPLNILSKGN